MEPEQTQITRRGKWTGSSSVYSPPQFQQAKCSGSAHSSTGPAHSAPASAAEHSPSSLPNRSSPRNLRQPRPGEVPAQRLYRNHQQSPLGSPVHPLGCQPSPAGFPLIPSSTGKEGYDDVPGTQTKPVGPEAFVECKEALALPCLGGETHRGGESPGPCPAHPPVPRVPQGTNRPCKCVK